MEQQQPIKPILKQQPDQQHHHHHHHHHHHYQQQQQQQQQQQTKPQHNQQQPKQQQQSGKEEDREHRQSSGTSVGGDGTAVIAATNTNTNNPNTNTKTNTMIKSTNRSTSKSTGTVATAPTAVVNVPKSYAYACQKKMNHYYHLRPLHQYSLIGRFLADYRRVPRNFATTANIIANSSAPSSPKSLRRNKLDPENHNADPLHSD